MGLFSFLSRRTGDRNKTNNFPKSRIQGISNVEWFAIQDAYAAAGDSSSAVETPSRPGLDFSQTQLSLDSASISDHEAPPPTIPRLREESVERPSTAPSSSPPSTVFTSPGPRLKRESKKRPPPLSFRMPLPGAVIPGSRPGSRSSERTVTSIFRGPSGRRSRASSLQSEGGRGFKDILDAQSEIKPADFRARVKATGARDYGEDVAERNMGENGFDLGSAHVQAFYARPSTALSARRDEDFLADIGGKLDIHQGYMSKRLLRPLSQNILSGQTLPHRALPLEFETTSRGPSSRRRSVSTFIPVDIRSIKGVSSLDRGLTSLENRLPGLSDTVSGENSSQLPSLGLRTPAVSRRPKTSTSTARTTRHARDSVVLAKRRTDAHVPRDVPEEVSPQAASSIRPSSRHRTSTFGSTNSIPRLPPSLHTFQPPISSIKTRDEIMRTTPLFTPRSSSLQHQMKSDLLEYDDVEAPCSPSRNPHPISFTANSGANPVPDEVLEYPPPIRTRTLRGWSASSGTPTASDSITTASINSYPFQRPPSLHTADTSVDITLSAVSLPLKPRPCSRDADCTNLGNDHNSHSDQDVDIATSPLSPPRFAAPDTTDIILSPTRADPDTFNIDDYLSTDDDDSMVTPNRRPTAEGEEELLFNESGYGAHGLQLPGLADPFPTSSSKSKERKKRSARLQRARSSPTVLEPVFTGYRGGYDWSDDEDEGGDRVGRGYYAGVGGRERRARTRKYILDTAAHDEDPASGSGLEGDYERDGDTDEEEGQWDGSATDEEVDMEALRQRMRRTRKKRTRRLSALCRVESRGNEQAAVPVDQEQPQREEPEEKHEEGQDEKLDTAAAVRLRKQVKRARRLAGQASAPRLRQTGPRSQRV